MRNLAVKDLVTVAVLETRNRVLTLRPGLLPADVIVPVINLTTQDQDVIDMAREELEIFYFRNKKTGPLGQPEVNFEAHKHTLEFGTLIYASNADDGHRIVVSAHFDTARSPEKVEPQVRLKMLQAGESVSHTFLGHDRIEHEMHWLRKQHIGALDSMPPEKRLNAVVVRAAHDHWVDYSKDLG